MGGFLFRFIHGFAIKHNLTVFNLHPQLVDREFQ